MTFVDNVKTAFDSSNDKKTFDSGQLVATIIMIAGLAILSLLAVNWIDTAILNKAADTGACVESSNTYLNKSSAAGVDCVKGDGGLESFKTDKGYIGRTT